MDLEDIQKHDIKLRISKSTNTNSHDAISKSFIIDLFYGIAKLAIKYYKHDLIDLPYIYGERQLDSLILPTLSQICNGAVLAELPATRNCILKNHEIEDSTGRIDYWCIYKNYSIVIEVKHSYDAFLSNKTRERTVIKKWEYMTIDQLQSIKDEVKQFEENTNGVIRLGLHFITSYSDKKPTKELIRDYKSKLPDILDRLKNDVSRCKPSLTSPDLMSCWIPPSQIVLNGKQTFPGIILISKTFKPIPHKGISIE